MNNTAETRKKLLSGGYSGSLNALYGINSNSNRDRYLRLLQIFEAHFGTERGVRLFCAPGRAEIIGNHTDHQRGCVIAQAVDLDIAAVVSENDENVIRIHSEGYEPEAVSLADLCPVAEERETSRAIIRGVAGEFKKMGYRIGGFDAVTVSDVPGGSGLSSSAAFEVLIGTILSHLYNDNSVEAVEIARMGQAAENNYFGKPSGLMDQAASSVGGLNFMDFIDDQPVIDPVDFDFNKSDYRICVVNTGASHADLTGQYAAIPKEMTAVADFLGFGCMREVQAADLYAKISALRENLGDRAVVRAMNFIDENERVRKAGEALDAGDIQAFKRLVIQSGYGSFMYLQNIVSDNDRHHQGLALALMISENFLRGRGAWRVHGGGFAGTILAFVPKDISNEYQNIMESVFGQNSCLFINARKHGGFEIVEN